MFPLKVFDLLADHFVVFLFVCLFLLVFIPFLCMLKDRKIP